MKPPNAPARPKGPLLVPFPEGLPVFDGRWGHYQARPGLLPVTNLNDDWDIFMITRGVAIWTLQNGERIEAGPGALAVLPPYTPTVVTERNPPVSFWFCHFDFRAPHARMRNPARANALGLEEQALLPLSFTAHEAPSVARAYRALNKLFDARLKRPWQQQRAMLELLAELALFAARRTRQRRPGRLLVQGGHRDERIARIQTLVSQDPTRAWRVTELAEAVGLSTGHLHELCRKLLGKSLKRFLVEQHLQQALRRLRERPAGRLPSVKEVAAACGFSSQHFFSRQFKQYYDLSPLEYRDGASLA